MSKSKMLQEAIADAKAVKDTAMANAKAALEEAFTPKLQSMISAKMMQEMDDEDMEGEEDYDADLEAEPEMDLEPEMDMDSEDDAEMSEDDDAGMSEDDHAGMSEDEDAGMSEEWNEEMSDEEDAGMSDDELELESIIKELEDEEASEDEEVTDEEEASEEEAYDDIDINEIIAALREDLDGDGLPDEGDAVEDETEAGESLATEELQNELEEAYKVINTMKESLNETNLLNAKLLFSNKLFKAYDLNESQKLNVIDNFDRAVTLREVKLVYATLAESMKRPAKRKVNESASKMVGGTAPKKTIISEGHNFQTRMQKLAGIKRK